ncbi:hypothetical protein J5N97_000178 [Dioscorea zingiberensis]|uniref:Uncharacterized protein n=1 Tax=Dioscorea zingiberensis TaxID=325984 RepID=A0A9D5H1N6_9LILI|nr:hypothetical protein J5N97_000178 [Dioscorea zingiberensis]
MSAIISESIALLRSSLQDRSFCTETLRALESILVVRDVRSLEETRATLRDLLKSEANSVLGEISDKSTDLKLGIVDFFVKAFAVVGDVESCLALKYEALVLRDTKFGLDQVLRVSFEEWLTFAKDSLDYGFYAIAVKGFDNALSCNQPDRNVDSEPDNLIPDAHIISNVKKLRDTARALIASHSVQTQAAEYLKRKLPEDQNCCTSCSEVKGNVASVLFRRGIKKRNMRKLSQSQGVQPH